MATLGINWYEVAISASFFLLFFGATVLLGLETWLLATGQPPITAHVRHEIANYPKIAYGIGFIAAFALGMLMGHFYWTKAGGGY
jgi:hypothetical protein